MGMYDSYYISKSFNCPCCHMKHNKEHGFQSKQGICQLDEFRLGSKLDPSRRYWDWYDFCAGHNLDKNKKKMWEDGYDKNKPYCKKGIFNCRVYLDEQGIAYREYVTMRDTEKDCDIFIYDTKND